MNLRTKYVVVLGSIAALPLIVVGAVATMSSKAHEIEAAHGQLDQVTTMAGARLTAELDSMASLLTTFEKQPGLRAVKSSLQSHDLSPAEAGHRGEWGDAWQSVFALQESMWGKLHHVFIADREGRIVLSPPKVMGKSSHYGYHLTSKQIEASVAGETHLTGFFGFEETDHYHPLLTVPIRGDDGSVVGVLVAEVVVTHLLDALNSESVESQGIEAKLFTPEGIAVVHGKGAELQNAASPGVKEAAAKGDVYGVYNLENGAHVMGRYHASVQYPWVLAVERPMSAITAPVRAMMMKSLMLTGAVVLGVLAIAFWLGNRASAPIRRLTERFGLIAQGDLAVEPMAVSGDDELSKLARSSDEMLASIRAIVGDVSAASERLGDASTRLHDRSERVTQAVNAQAMELMSVASAAEELASTSENTVGQSDAVVKHSAGIEEGVEAGLSFVTETKDSMRSLDSQLRAAAESIAELDALGDHVRGLVSGINEIAEQTNLLALNAAIESARAGEHGRGFAVVADEVRKLADRTSTATTEVAESLSRIQTGISQAASVMETSCNECSRTVSAGDEAASSIGELRGRAQEMGSVSATVKGTATEQTRTCNDVASSLAKIDSMTNDTNKTAGELSDEAIIMREQAENLARAVAQFKL